MTRFTKSTLSVISIFMFAMSCSSDEPQVDKDSALTGNEITYALQSGSDFNVTGTATFKETIDGFTRIHIELDKTFKEGQFPVHLHAGNVETDAAAIAALLAPIDAKAGKSVTDLKQLANESTISFAELKSLDACIKIHLSAGGEGRDVILAAGNIGSAVSKDMSGGRRSITVCASE